MENIAEFQLSGWPRSVRGRGLFAATLEQGESHQDEDKAGHQAKASMALPDAGWAGLGWSSRRHALANFGGIERAPYAFQGWPGHGFMVCRIHVVPYCFFTNPPMATAPMMTTPVTTVPQ